MTTTVEIPAQYQDDSSPATTVDSPTEAADSSTESTATDSTTHDAVVGDVTEREAEYFTIAVPWPDPAQLIIGPNVRTSNKTSPAMVRDIKRRGVDSPVHAYRDATGSLVVTVGQMRVLSAVEAKRTSIMVLIVPPPSEDEREAAIERIVKQLNENDLRIEMERADVFEAHRQLEMFGLSAAAIARRRSVGKKIIENTLAVGKNELASKAADEHDLDLEQAAVIQEFDEAGDRDGAKKLILTAVERPHNFITEAKKLRDDRLEAQRERELTDALTATLADAGVTVFDQSLSAYSGDARPLHRLRATPDTEPGTELTLDEHAACPGHGAWLEKDWPGGELTLVPEFGCSDFRAHGHALIDVAHGAVDRSGPVGASPGPVADNTDQAALERRKDKILRDWVKENNKLWRAAESTRREWLAGFVKRKSVPKDAGVWLATQKAIGHRSVTKAMDYGHPLAHELLKLTPRSLPAKIATMSNVAATIHDVFLTLAAMEEGIKHHSSEKLAWREPRDSDADYITALQRFGYKPHDVELQVITPDKPEDVVAQALALDDTDGTLPEDQDQDSAAADEDADGPDDTSPGENPEPEVPESSEDSGATAASAEEQASAEQAGDSV